MNTKDPMRLGARWLAFLWAGFWCFFAVATVASEHGGAATGIVVTVIWLALMIGTLFRLFQSEHSGALMLTFEGLALCVLNYTFLSHNPPATQLFLLLTLCLPPLLSGILLLKPWRQGVGVGRG